MGIYYIFIVYVYERNGGEGEILFYYFSREKREQRGGRGETMEGLSLFLKRCIEEESVGRRGFG